MPAARIVGSNEELLEKLKTSYPDILARLRRTPAPSSGNGR